MMTTTSIDASPDELAGHVVLTGGGGCIFFELLQLTLQAGLYVNARTCEASAGGNLSAAWLFLPACVPAAAAPSRFELYAYGEEEKLATAPSTPNPQARYM
jgi:hypothetical protein